VVGAGRHIRGIGLIAALAAMAILGALGPTAAGAASASWAFEPPAWDFGTLTPGAPATAPVPFTLRNTGESTLRPGLVSLESGEGGTFKFFNQCGPTLAPGSACAVEVSFRATASGPQESTLEMFEANGTVPPAVVHLSGAGTSPTVSIDQPSLDFGTVQLGAFPRPTRTATVTNTSGLDLTIKEIEFHLLAGAEPGTGLPPFGSPGTDSCRATTVLPAGGSCTITLSFIPRVVGPAAAELRIVDDALDSPQVISLSGTGTPQVIPPASLPAGKPEEPEAALGNHPPARTRSRSATFTFSAGPTAAGFVCRLDRGPFVPCTSPTHYGSLKLGPHRFQVRATGSDGTQTLSATYAWRVEAKPAHKKRHHKKPRPHKKRPARHRSAG
jgi:hypothetical protein